jgi:hypothetical protein
MWRSSLIFGWSAATVLLAVGCGTSATVSGGPSAAGDAGCTDQHTVEDGGGVVESPDSGVSACPSGVCNYQAQTGCAADKACRPQFSASSPDVSPGCEAAGSGKSGASCTASSDCAIGFFCAEGACRKQCCGSDWSACDAGESCIRQLQVKAGGKIIDSGMELCFPVNNCDPFGIEPCSDPTLECKIVDPTGAVACLPKGSAGLGDACDTAHACVAGTYCVHDHCRALCNADVCGQPVCAAGQGTCIHFNRDPVGVGECTPE